MTASNMANSAALTALGVLVAGTVVVLITNSIVPSILGGSSRDSVKFDEFKQDVDVVCGVLDERSGILRFSNDYHIEQGTSPTEIVLVNSDGDYEQTKEVDCRISFESEIEDSYQINAVDDGVEVTES